MTPGRLFYVYCCGVRRGLMPGGILVCYRCDFAGAHGPSETIQIVSLPNETDRKWWVANERCD